MPCIITVIQGNNKHELKLNIAAVTSKHSSCKYDCIHGQLQCDLQLQYLQFPQNCVGVTFTICKIYGGSFLKSQDELEGRFENPLTSLKMISLPSKVINDQPPYTCPKTKICSYSYSYSYTIYRSPHALRHLKVISIL